MPFAFDTPNYTALMTNAYNSCKYKPLEEVNFEEEVRKNLDTYGTYSKVLCCLWRYSQGIPLRLVPYVINQIPKVADERPYTMHDVIDYYHANKAWYNEFDTMRHAVKGLTSLRAAANDMMLKYVSGTQMQVPPINVRGINSDAEMLHFLCRSAITHELRSEYEVLMGKELP